MQVDFFGQPLQQYGAFSNLSHTFSSNSLQYRKHLPHSLHQNLKHGLGLHRFCILQVSTLLQGLYLRPPRPVSLITKCLLISFAIVVTSLLSSLAIFLILLF